MSFNLSIISFEKYQFSQAIESILLTSQHDHLAIYKNLFNSLFVSLSNHSAILFDILKVALSI